MASSSSHPSHSARGFAHQRGRGRGRGNGTKKSKPSGDNSLPPYRSFNSGLLQSPIQILSLPVHETAITAIIENAQYIGSYNWIHAAHPTILVPGSPPRWTGRTTPFTLSPDKGTRFKDQNGFRVPSSVLLPLLKAVDVMGKEIDWPAIDFVTDRNNLRKLMRWIHNGAKGRDFRIDMELAGKHTVLFNRFENCTKDKADGSFGFTFERETTFPAPGCERSTGHHRIIKYDFFGLKMVVRFEVDACLPPSEGDAELDSLTASLSALNVTSEAASTRDLRIIRAGSEVPQQSIIELASRSGNRIQWSEIFPQLYLSQTPWFYVGFHSKGAFNEVKINNISEMEERRKNLETNLQKLGQTLRMIQEIVIAHGTKKRLSLVCQEGKLSLHEWVSDETCLPRDAMRRFDANEAMRACLSCLIRRFG